MVKRSSNRVECPDRTVLDRWSGAAPFWEKHREIIRQMFAPVTQALVEDGMIDIGQVVLDIATGPGEPALSVATLVGPDGKVIGIDPIPEMMAAARVRQRMAGSRIPNSTAPG
jgi:ubiquinone/menaquinone biosynthesis C-methylase UbiE